MRAIGDAARLEGGGTALGGGGEFAGEVFLHDESADGDAVLGAEAAVLYIYGDGNLGMVHGGEAHEDGVVLPTVLGGAGLAADGEGHGAEGMAGASEHGGAHACYYPVVRLARRHGVVA